MGDNTIENIMNSFMPRHEKIGRLTALSDHYYRVHFDSNRNTPFNMRYLANKAEMFALKLMADANKEARERALEQAEGQEE